MNELHFRPVKILGEKFFMFHSLLEIMKIFYRLVGHGYSLLTILNGTSGNGLSIQ
jgi:hypothetical protein